MSRVFLCYVFLLLMGTMPLWGQEVEVPSHIKSVQLSANEDTLLPMLRLGERFTLSFDDLQASEEDYYYTLTHCDFHWKPSALHKSEYLQGIDEQRIEQVSNSFATIVPYTHYELTLPNAHTQLRLTGNYLLSILNSAFEVVFTRRIVVYTDTVSVRMSVYQSVESPEGVPHQCVQFGIRSNDFPLTDPTTSLQVAVVQNGHLQAAITHLRPQYLMGKEVVYKYDAPASFPAGNEYLYFENSDVRSTGKGTYANRLEADGYHSYLFTAPVRSKQPYTYSPDINGRYLISQMGARTPHLEADYTWVHFSLEAPAHQAHDEVYVYGDFSDKQFAPSNRLYYNPDTHTFEAKVLLKQGFYNYRFGFRRNGKDYPTLIDGNYYPTENQYTVIVYYRPQGALYDRIIGAASLSPAQVGRY